MIWLLPGCLFVTQGDLDHLLDGDQDGFTAGDLGGPDCDDDDPTVGAGLLWMDADGDGLGDPGAETTGCAPSEGRVDNAADCDDADPSVGTAATWYRDSDGDGAGDDTVATTACTQPDGYVADGDDCDDTTSAWGAPVPNYPDADGDGWGTEEGSVDACEYLDGYTSLSGDCDDDNAYANPDAFEQSDGRPVDYDCDGVTGDSRLDNVGLVFYGDYPGARMGPSAAVGDVDHDRFGDVAVGMPAWGAGGMVRIGYGADRVGDPGDLQAVDLADADAVWTGADGDEAGAALAVGDLGGDGLLDLVVGAPGAGDVGMFAVFEAPLPLSALTPDALVTASIPDGRFAAALAVGDVDGDGADDVLAGAPGLPAAYVVPGPLATGGGALTDGLEILFEATDVTETPVALAAGDLDGDGLDEAVLGAPWADGDRASTGVVYVCDADGSGVSQVFACAARVEGDAPGDEFGAAVAAFDVDGDGREDLVAGAPGADGGVPDVGAAYGFIHALAETEAARLADFRFDGEEGYADAGGRAGASLASAGDLDGDGLPDLAIAAPAWNDPYEGLGVGAVYFALGVPAGTTPLSASAERFVCYFAATEVLDGCAAGTTLAPGGDVDDDGIPDLLVGAPGWRWDGWTPTGAASVVFGKNVD